MLKKSAFINDLENIILYCGRIRAKPGIGHQIRFAPNLAGVLEAAEPMENLPLFKLARNCYINMSISFFWKLPDWFLFSLLQTY